MAEKQALSFDQNSAKFRYEAIRSFRHYFHQAGFIELETPYLLLANAPDPYIDPINVTTLAGGLRNHQLHTSPEIWLKRGLALGLERVYEMARVFRDDPLDPSHSKEFTMLEWYRTKSDLTDLIADCESLFTLAYEACHNIWPKNPSAKNPPSFLHMHLNDLCATHANLDLRSILSLIATKNPHALQDQLLKLGDHLPNNASFSEAFSHLLCKYIEPNLPYDQPVVLTGWPTQMAALAQVNEIDSLYCDRFEIYFRGLEIANAYQECNDASEITRRFSLENSERQKLGKMAFPLDLSFINDLKLLPKTAGIALGVDRLLMAALKKTHIKYVQMGA